MIFGDASWSAMKVSCSSLIPSMPGQVGYGTLAEGLEDRLEVRRVLLRLLEVLLEALRQPDPVSRKALVVSSARCER